MRTWGLRGLIACVALGSGALGPAFAGPPDEAGAGTTPRRPMVRFDFQDREAAVVDGPSEVGADVRFPGDSRAGQVLSTPDGAGAVFTNLRRVRDGRFDFPFSAVVKIHSKYDESERVSNCSGTLIGPKHVLTAAHCLYKHDRPSRFPLLVEVLPAYELGDAPFGSSVPDAIYVSEGWIDEEEYEYDYALIELERPLGALTSWMGYGYSDDCDFFDENVFVSAGYPVRPEVLTHAMYSYFGTFSECQKSFGVWYGAEITAPAPSFSGHSGGGAWTDCSGEPCVYAVLSNVGDHHSDFVRLTENEYHFLRSTIARSVTDEVDLVPIEMSLVPETLRPGERLDTATLVIYNDSTTRYRGEVGMTLSLLELPSDPEAPVPPNRFFTILDERAVSLDVPAQGVQRVELRDIGVPGFLDEGRYEPVFELDIVDREPWNDHLSGAPHRTVWLGPECGGKPLVSSGWVRPGLDVNHLFGEIGDAGLGRYVTFDARDEARFRFSLDSEGGAAEFEPELCLFNERFDVVGVGTTRIVRRLRPGRYHLGLVSRGEEGAGDFRLAYWRDDECSGRPLVERGEIGPRGDAWKRVEGVVGDTGDLYRFSVERTSTYVLSLCREGGFASFAPEICVSTASGGRVETAESSCGVGAEVVVTLPPGDYRVAVAPSAAGESGGAYVLAYSKVGACSGRSLIVGPSIRPTTALQVIAGSTPDGEEGIVHEVSASGTGLYLFQTCGSEATTTYDTEICVFDSAWNFIAGNDDGCGDASSVAVSLDAGTYWVAVSTARDVKGTYGLTYLWVPACEDRPLRRVDESIRPTLEPQVRAGEIDATAALAYDVEAAGAGTYRFSLCGGTDFAGRLCLSSSRGELISDGTDICRRQEVIELALQAGRYHLAVSAAPGASGEFELTYSVRPLCSRSELVSRAEVLEPRTSPQTVKGDVTSRSGEIYEVRASSDGEYDFRLCGPGGLADWETPYLCLYAESGEPIEADADACSGRPRIVRTLPAGVYHIAVSTDGGRGEGRYSLVYSRAEDPGGEWTRCDHNCDGEHDISDAIAGLVELFIDGRARSCCDETGDCNADGGVDLTDWIFLLSWQFGGGTTPAEPFDECGGAGCDAYDACADG